MDYSLEKLFERCFFLLGFIRHHIFCEIKQFENSKRMELRPAKKVKKRKILAKESKMERRK